MYTRNKYNAIRTEYDGVKYDSKFEATQAMELDLRVRAKDIKAWDRQFKVDVYAYNQYGTPVKLCSHRIDFRLHENDGSFTLLEAKGVATTDWKWRKKMLELFWLPVNPNYSYMVVKK